MIFTIKGNLKKKFELQTGTSARGQWARQEFIIETSENGFFHACKISTFNVDALKVLELAKIGDPLTVDFYIECNEAKNAPGKWYNEIRTNNIVNQINRLPDPSSLNIALPVEAPKPEPKAEELPPVTEDMPF